MVAMRVHFDGCSDIEKLSSSGVRPQTLNGCFVRAASAKMADVAP